MVNTNSMDSVETRDDFFSVIYLISNIFSGKNDSESCRTLRTGKKLAYAFIYFSLILIF
jgi:hypothetical protein